VNSSPRSLLVPLALLIFALALGVLVRYGVTGLTPSGGPPVDGMLWPPTKTLSAFDLVDNKGRRFDLDRLRGKWSFLFFGYTHCPDLCPATMNVFKLVARQVAADHQDNGTQFVFVTIDPARDTTKQLDNYVTYFNPDFIGAGGTAQQIDRLTTQLGVVHMRVKDDKGGENYQLDHSAAIMLVGPKARLLAVFSPPHVPGEIAERYEAIRAFMTRNSG
jgi:protein SCO1/2